MRRFLNPVCKMVVVAAVLAIATSPTHATPPKDDDTAYMMAYSWTSSRSDTNARGLSFFQSSTAGLASRVLVETPEGRHVVLTNELSVRPSWDRVLIRDDQTGWWFEVTQQYDVRAQGLQEFFSKALDWYMPGEGKTATFFARSQGGVNFVHEVSIASDPTEMNHAFVEALRADGQGAELLKEIPDGFSEAIRFLDAAFEGDDKRRVVEVLALLTDRDEDPWGYSTLTWNEDSKLNGNGVTVTKPDDLAFTSDFGTVDPRNPLGNQPLNVLDEEQPPVPGAR